MLAVRVPPSASSTSQSIHSVRSPSFVEVDDRPQAAADEPLNLDAAAIDLPGLVARLARVRASRAACRTRR